MDTQWQARPLAPKGVYEGAENRKTNEGQVDRHPCRPDLRFRTRSYRALAEVYACADLEGEVCERLRGGVDQSYGARSLSISSDGSPRLCAHFILTRRAEKKGRLVAISACRRERESSSRNEWRTGQDFEPHDPRFV